MAKDFDCNRQHCETGQPCEVTTATGSFSGYVVGGHEDGVSVCDNEGRRFVFHAAADDDRVREVAITGPAPSADDLAALHARWVEQAEALRAATA